MEKIRDAIDASWEAQREAGVRIFPPTREAVCVLADAIDAHFTELEERINGPIVDETRSITNLATSLQRLSDQTGQLIDTLHKRTQTDLCQLDVRVLALEKATRGNATDINARLAVLEERVNGPLLDEEVEEEAKAADQLGGNGPRRGHGDAMDDEASEDFDAIRTIKALAELREAMEQFVAREDSSPLAAKLAKAEEERDALAEKLEKVREIVNPCGITAASWRRWADQAATEDEDPVRASRYAFRADLVGILDGPPNG